MSFRQAAEAGARRRAACPNCLRAWNCSTTSSTRPRRQARSRRRNGRSGSPPAAPAAESLQRERAAAQNVFEAKQPAQNRNLSSSAAWRTLLAAVGIGGYFWWQMQPKGGLGSSPATARSAPPPAPIAAAPHRACAAACIPAAAPAATPAAVRARSRRTRRKAGRRPTAD